MVSAFAFLCSFSAQCPIPAILYDDDDIPEFVAVLLAGREEEMSRGRKKKHHL